MASEQVCPRCKRTGGVRQDGYHVPCYLMDQNDALKASARSDRAALEAVIRAAIEVTAVAFVNQKLTVKTPLHEPMQALMNALSDCPLHWEILKRMNDEDRAALAAQDRTVGDE